MPTETFFNLPEDKRARFVEVALEAFASAPYDQASITHIVKRLGIAKGSVYQYFEDKYDLFSWLVDEAVRRRRERFADLEVPSGDLFDRLASGYRLGLRHWLAEPSWNRVLLRVVEPSTEPRLAALRNLQQARVHGFLVAELTAAREVGEVRTDIDLETTAWLVQGMLQDGLLRAFLARLGTTLDAFTVEAPHIGEERLAEALEVADVAVELLRSALAPPS